MAFMNYDVYMGVAYLIENELDVMIPFRMEFVKVLDLSVHLGIKFEYDGELTDEEYDEAKELLESYNINYEQIIG